MKLVVVADIVLFVCAPPAQWRVTGPFRGGVSVLPDVLMIYHGWHLIVQGLLPPVSTALQGTLLRRCLPLSGNQHVKEVKA